MESGERATGAGSGLPPRILSIDALRGFDMFWILGVDQVIFAIRDVWPSEYTGFIAYQFGHATWQGFTFYDLIFPLFVFLVGITTDFSLGRLIERQGKAAAYKRIVRRFLLLYALAFVHDGVLWGENIRMLGVLQRIAWCYLVTSLLYCHLRPRGLVAVFAGILVGYWALMNFVPPPGEPAPTFAMHRNWSNWLDKQYLLPGDWEPRGWRNEGYLSTLPAIATCLLGTFTGIFLKDNRRGDRQKVVQLVLAGLVLLAAGHLWGMQFPVIKRIWTSSYVLVAGGYSLLLLAIFFYIIDIRRWRRWAVPFFWIGSNAILAYIAASIAAWEWFQGPFADALTTPIGAPAKVIANAIVPAAVIVVTYLLYRQRWYFRV